ncbi:MAG TPA: hypothetical protein VF591_13365 [Pyrinomonadaceae bacterium]|jgi:hypothetical protein
MFLGAALLLCLSAAGAYAQNDITVLTPLVEFSNKNGDEQTAILRVNFNPRVADRTAFTVYVKPNGPAATACPVFKGDAPLIFNDIVKPAPHRIKLVLRSNNTVSKQVMRCALTYSIVPRGNPANYFGFPEIVVPYRLK